MLKQLWIERLGSTFWLLPTLIAVGIVATLPFLTSIQLESDWPAINFALKDLSADGARAVLTAIATALMTVIGVLFSITIVVLQQVSTQYSPRVIENFIRSRTNQVVFGFYIATFIFCILLVRQIPDNIDSLEDLPQIAVAAAILLAICCFALLIHYIHHILHSIKSTTIIDTLCEMTLKALTDWEDSLKKTCEKNESINTKSFEEEMPTTLVRSWRRGYVQAYDWTSVASLLKSHPWKIKALARPGDYVQKDTSLFSIHTSQTLNKKILKRISTNIAIGTERTHVQDVRFGVRQLVDIALRALSPSLNDPTTAEEALNGIEAILLNWTKGHYAMHGLHFHNGVVTSIEVSDQELARLAVAQILVAAKEHPSIIERVKKMAKRLREANARPQLAATINLQIIDRN